MSPRVTEDPALAQILADAEVSLVACRNCGASFLSDETDSGLCAPCHDAAIDAGWQEWWERLAREEDPGENRNTSDDSPVRA